MGFVTGMLAGVARRQIDPAPILAALGDRHCRHGQPHSHRPLRGPVQPTQPPTRRRRFRPVRPADAGRQLRIPLPRLPQRPHPGRGPGPGQPLPACRAARPGGQRPPLARPCRTGHRRNPPAGRATPTTPAASSPSNGCSACCTAWPAGWPGAASALDSVIFPYRKPAHFADYALIFTEDSRFAPTVPGGTGTLVASFNANLLDLPIRRDEAALTSFLDGARARSPPSTGATGKWSSASATCCAPRCPTR